MNPTVSVITPTYYRNETLREAIESVRKQEYDPVEHIVVDDSGEGHARPVLAEYDDVQGVVQDENGGWAQACTTGIETATGEYIQLLDDDDYLLEGKLTKTAEILRREPDVGLSYCGVVKGEEGCVDPKPEVSGDILEPALRFQTFPLWTGSMLMERDVLTECMPLAGLGADDDLNIELGDTDLKIELARRTKVDYVDECLAYYRREGNGRWTGLKKFKKVKQNIRHQQELYDQHPELQRELLAAWYERQGRAWLRKRPWSVRAIICFLNSARYAREDRLPKSIAAVSSLFGRPGLDLARRVRDVAFGGSQSGTSPDDI